MGLMEDLKQETVAKLTLRKAVSLTADKTTRDAIEAMRRANLGCVIVIDNEQKPVGMFTEALLRAELSRDPNCVELSLGESMATPFPWVSINDPIQTVLDAMEAKNHRFVAVVDDTGKLVGLTGQKGLMEYVAEHFSEEVMVQRIGSEPYPHSREGA
jgi:CBS domain-containing protein